MFKVGAKVHHKSATHRIGKVIQSCDSGPCKILWEGNTKAVWIHEHALILCETK